MSTTQRTSLTHQEISGQMLRQARWLVRASGVSDRITADLDANRTGRPRTLNWEAFFVGLTLAVMLSKGQEVRLTGATRALCSLDARQRRELGIENITLNYSQFESGLADLVAATKHRTRTTAEGTSYVPPRLSLSITDIVNEFLRGVRVDGLPRTGHYAIDSTDQPTRARHRTRPHVNNSNLDADNHATNVETVDDPDQQVATFRDPSSGKLYPYLGEDARLRHTPDPDATEGYRSGKDLRHKEVFAGYDLHILTDCGEPGHPAFPVALFATSAGAHKGDAGVALIKGCLSRGMSITDVYGDRGYSHSKPEHWAVPLALAGIANHHDMHTGETRVHPTSHRGVITVDGGYFVASLPSALRNLTRPGLGASDAERQASAAQFDRRIPYAFKVHSIKPNGTIRYRGPALTGEVRCPNNPASMRLPRTRPLMTCTPDGCSCSKTFSVPVAKDRATKHRQPTLYGTTKWLKTYGRRNLIESFNATLKEHGTFLSARSFQVMTLPKVTLLTGLVMAVAALTILLVRYGTDPSHPHLAPKPGEMLVPVPREVKPREQSPTPPPTALFR